MSLLCAIFLIFLCLSPSFLRQSFLGIFWVFVLISNFWSFLSRSIFHHRTPFSGSSPCFPFCNLFFSSFLFLSSGVKLSFIIYFQFVVTKFIIIDHHLAVVLFTVRCHQTRFSYNLFAYSTVNAIPNSLSMKLSISSVNILGYVDFCFYRFNNLFFSSFLPPFFYSLICFYYLTFLYFYCFPCLFIFAFNSFISCFSYLCSPLIVFRLFFVIILLDLNILFLCLLINIS